jgi:sec-independent protein translocase protein TatA
MSRCADKQGRERSIRGAIKEVLVMGIFDVKHWLVVLVVVLLVFGGKRLRYLGSDLGEAIKGFRKSLSGADGQCAEQTRVESEHRQ